MVYKKKHRSLGLIRFGSQDTGFGPGLKSLIVIIFTQNLKNAYL